MEGQILKTSESLEERLKEYKIKEEKYQQAKMIYNNLHSRPGMPNNFIFEKTAEFIYANKIKEENNEENEEEKKDENDE